MKDDILIGIFIVVTTVTMALGGFWIMMHMEGESFKKEYESFVRTTGANIQYDDWVYMSSEEKAVYHAKKLKRIKGEE